MFLGHPETDGTLDRDPAFYQYLLNASHLPGWFSEPQIKQETKCIKFPALLALDLGSGSGGGGDRYWVTQERLTDKVTSAQVRERVLRVSGESLPGRGNSTARG